VPRTLMRQLSAKQALESGTAGRVAVYGMGQVPSIAMRGKACASRSSICQYQDRRLPGLGRIQRTDQASCAPRPSFVRMMSDWHQTVFVQSLCTSPQFGIWIVFGHFAATWRQRLCYKWMTVLISQPSMREAQKRGMGSVWEDPPDDPESGEHRRDTGRQREEQPLASG
jgi:hypothetical protein